MSESKQSKAKVTLTRTLVSSIALAAVLTGGVAAWNHVTLQSPMQEVLDEDSRNSGIDVRAHYKSYLLPGTLVFDLREVGGDKAPVDVFRVFLQFAHAMKSERFDRVELAFRGETKFVLDGAAFQEIGQEFGQQNPMYTVRTFPERLRKPDGSRAFEQWEGGALGVATQQMEDFSEFHRQWYIDEL